MSYNSCLGKPEASWRNVFSPVVTWWVVLPLPLGHIPTVTLFRLDLRKVCWALITAPANSFIEKKEKCGLLPNHENTPTVPDTASVWYYFPSRLFQII